MDELVDLSQPLSLRQFARLPDQHRYDLVGGMVEEKRMGSLASWVGGELFAYLRAYCRERDFGWVWHANVGFACFGGDTVRFPHVAALRFSRLPNGAPPDEYIRIAPDLVAEIVSPSDRVEDLEDRLSDYRGAGVRLVWVIFPGLRIARVHRLNRTITELGKGDSLDGEDVLPGFQVRVSALFPTARGNNS